MYRHGSLSVTVKRYTEHFAFPEFANFQEKFCAISSYNW